MFGSLYYLYRFILKNFGKNPTGVPSNDELKEAQASGLQVTTHEYQEPIRPPEDSSFYTKYQWEIWNTFEQEVNTKIGKALNVFFISVILFSVILLICETEKYFTDMVLMSALFYIGELFTLLVFTIDYSLRIWSCPSSRYYRGYGNILGRIRFSLSLWSLLDLIALIPSYFYLFITSYDLVFDGEGHGIRLTSTLMFLIRSSRFLRIFRVNKFTQGFGFFWNVIKSKYRELLISATLLFTTFTIFSFGMYTAEKGAQPDEFGSIPRTFYYTIVTMTTIGYGDVTPKTVLGKIIFCCFSMIPVMVFAIPTSIIGAGFIEEITKQQQEAQQQEAQQQEILEKKKTNEPIHLHDQHVHITCPHCKQEFSKTLKMTLDN